MAYDNPFAVNFVKKFEGYTPKPKWDHKQYSVGYGTKWVPGQPIGGKQDHEAALLNEVSKVDGFIAQNVKVPLDEQKRAALTSFGYNLGPGAIQRLLPDINAGNWDRVGQRMLSFNKASGQVNPGLVSRRAQEAALLTGQSPPSAYMAQNAVNQVQNGGPMAGPIGGAPVQGGPVPLTPPNQRYSKLADLLMAQAAGADVKGWGDALRALGGASLGYSLANKADTDQQAYQGKLAQALMGANSETLPQQLMATGDPQMVQQGVALKIAQGKKAEPMEIERRAIAGGLQPGTPEYRDFILKGGRGQTGEEYGTSPLYVKDPTTGKVKIGQMSKAGGIKYTDVEGDILPGTDKIDAGTEYVFRDKRTNEIVGRQPKDVAGEASQKEVGKSKGEAMADLPRVESNSEAIISMIDSVINDPYLPSMTGMVQGRMPNLTGDSQRVQSKVDQLNGQAFLQAFSALKGGGAITEAEGAKATASLSRLQNMNVNDPDYIKAATDFKAEVTRLRDLARRKAGALSQQGVNQRLQSVPQATPDQSAPDPLGIR